MRQGSSSAIIVALDRKPIANRELTEALLKIFAVRAAAELERRGRRQRSRFRIELSGHFRIGRRRIFVHDWDSPAPSSTSIRRRAGSTAGRAMRCCRLNIADFSSNEPPYSADDGACPHRQAKRGEMARFEWHRRNKRRQPALGRGGPEGCGNRWQAAGARDHARDQRPQARRTGPSCERGAIPSDLRGRHRLAAAARCAAPSGRRESGVRAHVRQAPQRGDRQDPDRPRAAVAAAGTSGSGRARTRWRTRRTADDRFPWRRYAVRPRGTGDSVPASWRTTCSGYCARHYRAQEGRRGDAGERGAVPRNLQRVGRRACASRRRLPHRRRQRDV